MVSVTQVAAVRSEISCMTKFLEGIIHERVRFEAKGAPALMFSFGLGVEKRA